MHRRVSVNKVHTAVSVSRFPTPNGPFSYESEPTAHCAHHWHLVRKCSHCLAGILHRDVHPGNVGLLCAPTSSFPTTDSTSPGEVDALAESEQECLFMPALIDYQWSTLGGFHPHIYNTPTIATWPYLSDRVLREPGAYQQLPI